MFRLAWPFYNPFLCLWVPRLETTQLWACTRKIWFAKNIKIPPHSWFMDKWSILLENIFDFIRICLWFLILSKLSVFQGYSITPQKTIGHQVFFGGKCQNIKIPAHPWFMYKWSILLENNLDFIMICLRFLILSKLSVFQYDSMQKTQKKQLGIRTCVAKNDTKI